ncbi:MAG TPA: hypothetical protein VKR06_39840 [Ktedonosporobacter sp.]|nr:hypothetical protein [Ktedonosporobacter sp.]
MLRRDDAKSWLLGLLSGALLVGINFFLVWNLYSPNVLMAAGSLLLAYLIVSAVSAWIVALWTESSDAGLKAGYVTGLSGGIGTFCAILTFVLIISRGQLFGGLLSGYAVGGLLAILLLSILGICVSLIGALLGCRVANVEL